jgi:uncharacterized protein YqjF (DUF2071 family)
MRHCWRDLLFLHWEANPEELRRRVPAELTLDTSNGKAYIGLVAFTMPYLRLAKPLSWQIENNVHEVNVRTYVHRNGRDPGVWFFSLDTPSLPAVAAARYTYKLPYHLSRIYVRRGESGVIRYRADRVGPPPTPAGCDLEFQREGNAAPALPGSLGHFLAERYILYSMHHGSLHHAYVNHVPYPLQTAQMSRLDESLIAAAGISRPDSLPIVHYARMVEVDIYALRQVPTGEPPSMAGKPSMQAELGREE